jgi:hypothetical protein
MPKSKKQTSSDTPQSKTVPYGRGTNLSGERQARSSPDGSAADRYPTGNGASASAVSAWAVTQTGVWAPVRE